jgi:tetratricopeptide (TPR) repeat protein
MELGRYQDAHETITTALTLFPEDPLILHSCARAAARAGDAGDAVRFIEKSLEMQPLMSTLLIEDPHLEEQRSVAVETLQRLHEAAQNRHATTTERWQKALDLVRRAESRAEVAIPIPAALTEGGAEAENEEDDNRAALVLDTAEAILSEIVQNATEVEFRQKRYIDKLFSDRATWQQSMEGLKNEAKAMNLDLSAPPPKKGLFGKKKQGHESVFLNYHNCRHTLVTIETQIRDNLPELKAKLAEATKRHEVLETTLSWLRENGAPLR